MLNSIKRWISLQTPKYKFLKNSFGDKPFRMLDVGCGAISPRKTKALFPNCEYTGLDKGGKHRKDYIAADLDCFNFSYIKDNYFDAIWITHVLEHLTYPTHVLTQLVKKLKPGGSIYIETPSEESKYLPFAGHGRGTLNFHDDPTHVGVVDMEGLNSLASDRLGLNVIKTGTRRSWFHIIAIPFRLLIEGYNGNIFWDWHGFANYTYLQKQKS